MGRYYCDYCDAYLTHDSPSVRKTHCSGRKHKDNVRIYYQKWMEEQAKKLLETAQKNRPAGMPAAFAPPPGLAFPSGGLPPGFRPPAMGNMPFPAGGQPGNPNMMPPNPNMRPPMNMPNFPQGGMPFPFQGGPPGMMGGPPGGMMPPGSHMGPPPHQQHQHQQHVR